MKWNRAFAFAIVGAFVTATGLRAQVPGVPAAPAAPAVPGVPGAPAAPSNLWSYLMPNQGQLDACHQKFCAHPIGQFINNMLKPATLFSGGLISPCCPPDQPNPNDLNKPATSGEGAAAAIMADEAGAKARRAAMRYLGTVDCHYWPEAEAALIGGLRTDKNECVRWEAAMSLGKGCCCTRKTIEALKLVVEGSEVDGNPSETSDRVRASALAALYHCLSCYHERPVGAPKERPPTPLASRTMQSVAALLPPYYAELEKTPAQVISDARKTLAQSTARPDRPTLMPTGTHSLAGLWNNAVNPPTASAQDATPKPPITAAEPQPIVPVAAATATASKTKAANEPRDLWHIIQRKLNSDAPANTVPQVAPGGKDPKSESPPPPPDSPGPGRLDPAVRPAAAKPPEAKAPTAGTQNSATAGDLFQLLGLALEPQ